MAGDFRARKFSIGKTDFPYGEFVQTLITFVVVAAVSATLCVLHVAAGRLINRHSLAA